MMFSLCEKVDILLRCWLPLLFHMMVNWDHWPHCWRKRRLFPGVKGLNGGGRGLRSWWGIEACNTGSAIWSHDRGHHGGPGTGPALTGVWPRDGGGQPRGRRSPGAGQRTGGINPEWGMALARTGVRPRGGAHNVVTWSRNGGRSAFTLTKRTC